MSDREKVVLAYSGGLDTSVIVKMLQERGYDVITVTADLGAQKNLEEARQKALDMGAVKAEVLDARQAFVDHFVWPALQAGAVYEDAYPLATALGRPLISKLLADVARREGATAAAHGCTGKGNDQVRMEVSLQTLNPDLDVVAPAREWDMTRDDEIEYAREHGIEVEATSESPYSTDENLWGRSVECGVLEDPWQEPPEEAYEWTCSPEDAPEAPEYVDITFERGVPVALDGTELGGIELIQRLNETAGRHGVGRIDMVENRLVGIKSREVYEAPAAVVLHAAHHALESMTLSRSSMRFKQTVSDRYADIIYDGLWFSGLHHDLAAYVLSSQRTVSGTVRMKLYKGEARKAGVRSEYSLYEKQLATYDEEDAFRHRAAEGFIELHGLPSRTEARLQGEALDSATGEPNIIPPEVQED